MRFGIFGRLMAVVFCVTALSACQGVKKQLGLTKQSPDEFTVVKRAPLSVPPNFALRPPVIGAPRPQEGLTHQQARKNVFRIDEDTLAAQERSRTDSRTLGEKIVLANAGSDQVEPDIRTTVERETGYINENSGSLLDFLIHGDLASERNGIAVNPGKEAERLRKAQTDGEPLHGEEIPTIDRRKKGLFDSLL